MPLGILRAVDQRVQLGPEPFDDAEIAREGEADRRARRLAAAASRLRPRCVRPADRRAGWRGRDRPSPGRACSRSAPRTAARAARAGCRRRTCARSTTRSTRPFEIGAAAMRVEIFIGERIPGDGVDREVAAARRFLDRKVRIAGHLEAAMPASDLRFAPRQRDVEVRDLVDGEALADGVDGAERGEHVLEPIRGEAEDLEIDILRIAPEQLVADPAADDQRAAARHRGRRARSTARCRVRSSRAILRPRRAGHARRACRAVGDCAAGLACGRSV